MFHSDNAPKKPRGRHAKHSKAIGEATAKGKPSQQCGELLVFDKDQKL
jgi:hypothetical protein